MLEFWDLCRADTLPPVKLDRARESLERAGRLVNALADKEDDATAFRDAVPYAVEQLDVVTSLIDKDSRGHRTPAFSAWWNGQHPLKDALHELRNAEVKEQEKRTGRNATIQVGTVGTVVGVGNLPPKPESQPPRGWMYWTFTSGGFVNQEVLPTLRDYYDRLLNNAIPTAERLLV